MALKPTKCDEIAKLEDDLADIAAKLRKMRQEWAENKAGELDLEIEKAVGFVDYLKGTWVHRCYAQFHQSLARNAMKSTRESGKVKRN